MSNYNSLKATINANIKTNGNQEITGSVLNSVLTAMVNTLGAGYMYAGVASPSGNPGSPDAKIFYLAATAGTYTNFGGIVLSDGEVAVLKWDSAWHKESTGFASQEQVNALVQQVNEIANIKVPKTLDGIGAVSGKFVSADGSLVSGGGDFLVQVYSVSAGDIVTIDLSGGVGSASYLYGLYNGTSLSHITSANLIELGNRLGNSNGRNTIQVESDCLLAVTIYANATYGFSSVKSVPLQDAITEMQEEVESLKSIDTIEALDKVGEVDSQFISSTGALASGGTDFHVEVYPVSAGDKITIELSGGVGSAYLYGLYNGSSVSDVTAANLISLGRRLSQSNGTNIIDVANNCILAVTFYQYASYAVSRAIKETNVSRIDTLEETMTSRFSLSDNTLRVASPYGDVDLLVTLAPTGGNGLFDFVNVKTTPKDTIIGVGPETLVFNAGTDWVAPFVVAAKTNIDGDNMTGGVYNEYFTGGNHQYNNTGSGSTPTARLTSLAFFVDGRKVTSGHGYFKRIRVEWTNDIQAYNTTKADGSGRAVLREKRVMEIEGNHFKTMAQIIALEDITIKTWYGLQYSAVQIYPNTNYPGGANRGVYTGVSDCGNKKPNGIVAQGTAHRLEMFADLTFGVGNRDMYTGNAGAFRTATKGYLWIIKDADLNSGESVFLRGSWRFLPVV